LHTAWGGALGRAARRSAALLRAALGDPVGIAAEGSVLRVSMSASASQQREQTRHQAGRLTAVLARFAVALRRVVVGGGDVGRSHSLGRSGCYERHQQHGRKKSMPQSLATSAASKKRRKQRTRASTTGTVHKLAITHRTGTLRMSRDSAKARKSCQIGAGSIVRQTFLAALRESG
jgi:hypothetical protein